MTADPAPQTRPADTPRPTPTRGAGKAATRIVVGFIEWLRAQALRERAEREAARLLSSKPTL